MKIMIIVISLFFGFNLKAQNPNDINESRKIDDVIKKLVQAWSNGDAEMFASPFTEDADFTVWFGMKLNGQKEIAFGHNIIFKEFYANTVWDLKIDKIRFLCTEVAIVHCSGAILKEGMDTPNEPDAVPMMVLNKIGSDWKIIAFQNTPFAVNEFRENGDLQRMKKIMRDYKD